MPSSGDRTLRLDVRAGIAPTSMQSLSGDLQICALRWQRALEWAMALLLVHSH